jgi:hypothetical protein
MEKCKKDNKKPAGFSAYRSIFCKEYNLGFLKPKKISVVFVQFIRIPNNLLS